ncbi:MAG: prepilin-type N-terminal cleavage/methylation domain-containing protein [Planctomycetes bacterium]|nr:prepilin-type N-terminal cleavage/methylation domain-containing protein [Planctomycetota bacterium]MBI3846617.1 prepilin-type N-terminal cleavage/methylation domain-containing protein [Planctomycetota bacterium]
MNRSTIHDVVRSEVAGFTLLEVLLAVAIFASATISVALITSNATNEADLTEKLGKADMLLREKMSNVLFARDRYDDGDSGTYDDPAFAGFAWTVHIDDVPFLGGPDDDSDPNSPSTPLDPIAASPNRRRAGPSSRGAGSSIRSNPPTPQASSDLFGAQQTTDDQEWLQKITVDISFPYYRGTQTVSAVTYVDPESPPPDVTDPNAPQTQGASSPQLGK